MHTRSRGRILEPIQLEVHRRRRNVQRNREPVQLIPMDNNGAHLNRHPVIQQLQQQLELVQKELEEQAAQNRRLAETPVRNLLVHGSIPGLAAGPEINANTFELKYGLIQTVEQHSFGGRATEDPNKHLSKFLEISNTVKHNGVPDDNIKMRFFPFSLIDAAKDWYDGFNGKTTGFAKQED